MVNEPLVPEYLYAPDYGVMLRRSPNGVYVHDPYAVVDDVYSYEHADGVAAPSTPRTEGGFGDLATGSTLRLIDAIHESTWEGTKDADGWVVRRAPFDVEPAAGQHDLRFVQRPWDVGGGGAGRGSVGGRGSAGGGGSGGAGGGGAGRPGLSLQEQQDADRARRGQQGDLDPPDRNDQSQAELDTRRGHHEGFGRV